MKCKKCKMEIEDQSVFCSYCGERVEKEQEYIDPFQEYRIDSSHDTQYQYQQHYGDSKKIDDLSVVKEAGFFSSKSCSILGIILSMISIFGCFFNIGFGISLLVISLFFIIRGFHHATRGLRIASVLTSIFSTVTVFIVSIILWIFSLTITLSNGMKYTIKEYLLSMFFNSYYSDHVYGMWMTNANEVLDLTGGFYYTLYDQNGETLSEGSYRKIEGYHIENDDVVYSDREFYFFGFIEETGSFTDGETLILCLDKSDFSRMVLYFPKKNISIETEKISRLPYNKDSISDEIAPGIVG